MAGQPFPGNSPAGSFTRCRRGFRFAVEFERKCLATLAEFSADGFAVRGKSPGKLWIARDARHGENNRRAIRLHWVEL